MVPPKSPSPRDILDELSKSRDLEIKYSLLEPKPVLEEGIRDQFVHDYCQGQRAIQAYMVNMVNNEKGEPQPEPTDPPEKSFWAAVASFGLFKLFYDRENQGFPIPIMTPPSSVTNNSHIRSPLCKRRKKDNPGFHPCKKLPDYPSLMQVVWRWGMQALQYNIRSRVTLERTLETTWRKCVILSSQITELIYY